MSARTFPGCPDWCTRDHFAAGARQLEVGGVLIDVEIHSHHVGRVQPLEAADNYSASVSVNQGHVDDGPQVWVECQGAEFTSAAARRFAAHLLNAADIVDGKRTP